MILRESGVRVGAGGAAGGGRAGALRAVRARLRAVPAARARPLRHLPQIGLSCVDHASPTPL